MNRNTTDDNIIQIDQISSEQHLHIDNQLDQNSTLNNTKSKEVDNGIKQRKKSSMIPTPLYVFFFSFSNSTFKYFIREYSWGSTHQNEINVGIFILFIIITIILSIIIVCFTQPKSSGMIILFYIEINFNSKDKFVTINFKFLDKNFSL
jgi:hypothetical protein